MWEMKAPTGLHDHDAGLINVFITDTVLHQDERPMYKVRMVSGWTGMGASFGLDWFTQPVLRIFDPYNL